MVYDIPADPEWDLQALLAKVSDLCKEAVAGGIFLGDIGDQADQHDVTSAVAELQNQRFSVLRSLSRTLGATQEDRRADYGAEDRIKATIDRIAKLRVPVNSSFVLLTAEDAFVLETIASEIGADQEKIDNCIDEDDEVEIKLIKLIFETDSGFLFWEHTPKPENKKQKVSAGPQEVTDKGARGGIDLTADEQDQDLSLNRPAEPQNLQELL